VYKIVFSKQATKSLVRMPRDIAKLIQKKLEQVAVDPFADHPTITRLQNRSGYRLRVGDWRVIYEIQNDKLVIMVLKVASRGEVYR